MVAFEELYCYFVKKQGRMMKSFMCKHLCYYIRGSKIKEGNGKESEKVSRQQKWYLQRFSGLKEYDMLKVLEEGKYGYIGRDSV